MPTSDDVLQLAIFTAAIDARRYGAELQPGIFYPTWEERGPAGQEAYINDAMLQFRAVEIIQSGNPSPLMDLVPRGEAR